MKKLLALSLLVIVPFFSCESNNDESKADTKAELSKLTQDYIDVHKNDVKPKWPPRWLKIVLADCAGAVGGAGLGGPVGAVIGGAASSASVAAGTATVSPQPPGYEPTVVWPAAARTSLPYDNIGYHHYQLLNNGLYNLSSITNANHTTINNAAFYAFAKNYLVNDAKYFTAAQVNAYDQHISQYCIDITARISNYDDAKAVILQMYGDGTISQDVSGIMRNYFDAYQASADLRSFTDYSVSAEEIVTQSTTLSAHDKIVLSCAMSTLRVGSGFWN